MASGGQFHTDEVMEKLSVFSRFVSGSFVLSCFTYFFCFIIVNSTECDIGEMDDQSVSFTLDRQTNQQKGPNSNGHNLLSNRYHLLTQLLQSPNTLCTLFNTVRKYPGTN